MDDFDEFARTAPPRPPGNAADFYGIRPLQGVQTTPPMRGGREVGPAPPVYGAGNINLSNRPEVLNPDGSISTVRSMSANIDGHEVLMPTVSEDARIMSDDEAVRAYLDSGRNLGIFDTPGQADEYAQQLHERQSTLPTGNPTSMANTFMPAGGSARPARAPRPNANNPSSKAPKGKVFIDRIEDNGMAVLIDHTGSSEPGAYTTRNVPAKRGWREGQYIDLAATKPAPRKRRAVP